MDKSLFNSLIDISKSEASQSGKANLILEKARWASTEFCEYNRDLTMQIVDNVAKSATINAEKYAKKAVLETGFGVVAHKKIKNELTAQPLVDYYRSRDFVNSSIDDQLKIIQIPRPAGVIFALTPSTNPIATLNYKVLLSLMTRNSIVLSPHPAAKETSIEAAQTLRNAAIEAGAPVGAIQILEEPSIPLVQAFMKSPKTNVILATGGSPMVRAAYSSSNPAIGVGPGNVPVFVDSSANISEAAKLIVLSKSFDNSVLCTNESVLITLDEIFNKLLISLKSEGAYICDEQQTNALRNYLFYGEKFNISAIGRDAVWIAKQCGINVPSSTKILITPIQKIGIEEKLSSEKLCPVLALHKTKSIKAGISQSRAVLRLAGAGHSAAIHSTDEKTIIDFSSRVETYRVVVNSPSSQGCSGFATNLAPTMTVGTGFFGRSSIGENIGPQHLVHWTKIAYNAKEKYKFGNFNNLERKLSGPLPKSPEDGIPNIYREEKVTRHTKNENMQINKNDLKQIIAEELQKILRK